MIWLKRIGIGLGGLIALVLVAVSLMDTKVRPSATVLPGYAEARLDVAHRDVPLQVFVWYPANQETGLAELIGQNALFYGHNVLKGSVPDAGAHPLIVFSHGSGGNAVRTGWIAADLARAGHIVIATNHPGTTSGDSDPHRTPHIWDRSLDLQALIDFALEVRPAGITVDADRIGALGFSLGGFSALSVAGAQADKDAFIAYCDRHAGKVDCGWMQSAGVDFTAIDADRYNASYRDARIRSVVAVDPALPQATTAESLGQITADALILNLGETDTVPPAMRADSIAATLSGATYIAIPGAQHFSFLAECSLLGKLVIAMAGEDNICSDAGLRDRRAVQEELSGLITGHFTRSFAAQ